MTEKKDIVVAPFQGLAVINQAAARRVAEMLPELTAMTRAFDRANTQSTLAFQSLTLITGQSPYRMIRQVLAETEARMLALAEAQVSYAKRQEELAEFMAQPQTPLVEAEIRHRHVLLETLAGKINGALKDIAVLSDAYENIKAKHGIGEWDEASFEASEKRHHIRRGFELVYRNILDRGRAGEAAIEYLHQYGVHAVLAMNEVLGYLAVFEERLKRGERPSGADFEQFLDQMADKYRHCADEVSDRIYGKMDCTNVEYMLRREAEAKKAKD